MVALEVSAYATAGIDAERKSRPNMDRHRDRVQTGFTKAPEKSGEKKCAKWYGIVVSADGFEPSTHALKGRRLRVLPRGTNDLAYQTTVQIGAKHPQSAVNLQLIYIRGFSC